MSKFLISIIMPVYNAEEYIDMAIESLKGQTIGFNNLQIIMVDDCSTDNSKKIMQKYMRSNDNIFCIFLKENSGAAGKPRNKAIECAEADYIMFLDPDDYYQENACRLLYNTIKNENVDCVSGYYQTVNENNEIIEKNALESKQIEGRVYELPLEIRRVIDFRSSFCTKIYKKKVVCHNGITFPEEIAGQDMVFFCNYILSIRNIKYVDANIYSYRIRDKKNKSISNNYTLKFFKGINESYKACHLLFKQKNLDNIFEYFFAGTLNFYLKAMMQSNLSLDELVEVMDDWEWTWKFSPYNMKEYWVNCIREEHIQKNHLVVPLLLQLRPIYQYQVELKEAVEWHKNNYEEAIVQLEDLKKWEIELEKARDFYQQQTENMQKVVLEKDDSIGELEKARDYYKDLYEKEQIEKQEMAKRLSDIQNNYDEMEINVKKWKYKYNKLVEEEAIKKIIKKKKIEL